MPYKFLPDIAIADVAFEASGRNLNEMLESAALATTNVMVKDLKTVKPKVSKSIKIKAENEEMLLFNFLQEIIYQKDANLLLFSKYAVKTKKTRSGYELSGTAKGEKLSMKKHELMVDVKAVTMHMFEVRKTKAGWKARIILDI